MQSSLASNAKDLEAQTVDNFVSLNSSRKTIAVQGVGFVGAAMLVALARAKDNNGDLLYNVIGVDLESNSDKLDMINAGISPIVSLDKNIDDGYKQAKENGNLLATHSTRAYELADVVIVDINLDINKAQVGNSREYSFSYGAFEKAISVVAESISEDTVVLLETTVPPGTTEKLVHPIFKEVFSRRGLDPNKVYIGYSYERVMPGKNYLDSIVNNHRVYSAVDAESKDKIRLLLESFINTEQYPLRQLHSTTAAEMAKVLENSFRAMNIAFIQEWTEFADGMDVDLYSVINAIRERPTHKNIMYPGFGVGGYCLTKDSLLGDWALKEYVSESMDLGMSLTAVETNDLMPMYTFNLLKSECENLQGLNLAILGLSYLPGVGDTRYSPTELFYDTCVAEGVNTCVHDPLVPHWDEKDQDIETSLSDFAKTGSFDVVVFTIGHPEYISLKASEIANMFPKARLIVDAFNVLSDQVASELKRLGFKVIGVGKGHWNRVS